MTVQDFNKTYEPKDEGELISCLSRQYGSGYNTFWMAEAAGTYPVLILFVNGDLASLNYLPRAGHAGFVSTGSVPGLERNGTTMFFLNLQEEQPVLNGAIVPRSLAVEAAREFMNSVDLPRAIKWLEL